LTNAVYWGLDKTPPPETTTTATPQFVLRVQVVRLADDDGRRPANLTPTQFREWVRFANRIYRPAGVRFEFDPNLNGEDWTPHNSTILNSYEPLSAGLVDRQTTEAARKAADRLTAKFPRRLVVLARHGVGEKPSGSGFSWTDYDHVVVPGFWDAWTCGHQNIRLFGHETGHYLGLPHPFTKEFKTVAEADAYFKTKKSNPRVFDGDKLADTPPEPFIKELQDQFDRTTIKLGNHTFQLMRNNLMTYYHEATEDRTTLTKQQAALIHKTLREHPQRRTLVQE
jgi:hypothetical protein